MHPLLLLYSLVAVTLFSISTPSFAYENEALRGFSVDLIHRNSPLSPLYKSSCQGKSYEAGLKTANYTYLVRVRVNVGDDDDEKFATLDTGSNMTWLNGQKCEGNACTSRFKFKPTDYDTPKDLCDKCRLCPKCHKEICANKKNICRYNVTYGDNFTTGGVLTSGDFSFPCSDGIQHKFNNIWFGVSDYSNGTFDSNSAGIVGLGRGELSLFDQLVKKGRFDFKFSYCLPQHPESVSKLSFGDHVTISEGKSAILLKTSEKEVGYFVNLISIHVNENEENVGEKNQKIMIDSGTTVTLLNEELFKFFSESVKKEIGKHVETRKIDEFDVCFKHDEKEKVKIPTVKFDFEGKSSSRVTVELKQENFLEKVPHENTNWLCLMVNNTRGNEEQILGSRAQMGFKVAFNIKDKEVSFDPQDCDKKTGSHWPRVSFDPPDCGK